MAAGRRGGVKRCGSGLMSDTEVLFYHLEHMSLEQLLPTLLEKSLARGWRVVVQGGSRQRLEALNMLLWTYRDDSFLPHGMREDGHAERQPIYLTEGDDNPNGAGVRFFIDGAPIGDLAALGTYDRSVYIFDGADPGAVAAARAAWKNISRAPGLTATYWQQTPQGRWQKKG